MNLIHTTVHRCFSLTVFLVPFALFCFSPSLTILPVVILHDVFFGQWLLPYFNLFFNHFRKCLSIFDSISKYSYTFLQCLLFSTVHRCIIMANSSYSTSNWYVCSSFMQPTTFLGIAESIKFTPDSPCFPVWIRKMNTKNTRHNTVHMHVCFLLEIDLRRPYTPVHVRVCTGVVQGRKWIQNILFV